MKKMCTGFKKVKTVVFSAFENESDDSIEEATGMMERWINKHEDHIPISFSHSVFKGQNEPEFGNKYACTIILMYIDKECL